MRGALFLRHLRLPPKWKDQKLALLFLLKDGHENYGIELMAIFLNNFRDFIKQSYSYNIIIYIHTLNYEHYKTKYKKKIKRNMK